MAQNAIRSNQKTRWAADRTRRMIEPTRLNRTSEPHHQQKRRPVHSSFFCQATEQCRDRRPGPTGPGPQSHTTSTKKPRSIGTPAAPRSRSAHPSFPQNDIRQCGQRCERIDPLDLANPPPHIEPPRSIGTINSPFRENARRPNRSFKNDESGRSSIPLHHACPHWAAGPTSRPDNLSTPPTPDHAVTPKRSPHFVPS